MTGDIDHEKLLSATVQFAQTALQRLPWPKPDNEKDLAILLQAAMIRGAAFMLSATDASDMAEAYEQRVIQLFRNHAHKRSPLILPDGIKLQ